LGTPEGRPPGVALFAWVKQELLGSIARAEFSPDEPFVTQREIVERFGVSTTTAIRALNELVTEGVVVRRRGRGTFVAPRPAPARPAAVHRLLTYIGPDSSSAHESKLLAGLAAESAELGYRLAIEHTRGVGHEEQVLRRMAGTGTAGVVLFPRERSTAGAAVEELRRAGVAVAVVDRYFPGLPTDAVVFDDFRVGHDVTDAVLDRGHRNVLVLWSEVEVTSVRDRLAGHRRALRERGLPELPERSALRTYYHLDPGPRRQRLRSLLGSPDVDRADPVTAVICGNGPTFALAVADLLALEAGFPGEVELASMDQAFPDEVSPLTVVSAGLPAREMGRTAARLVDERIGGATGPLRHEVLGATVQVADRSQNTLAVIGGGSRPPAGLG
jgi:GntR family transcriptional regulator, arabinose operon transcriptional repressor